MSGAHDAAVEAMKKLLWELPAEFSEAPPVDLDSRFRTRDEFHVFKRSNVLKVWEALYDLQKHLGMIE